jgi:hypothetical protein
METLVFYLLNRMVLKGILIWILAEIVTLCNLKKKHELDLDIINCSVMLL